MSFGSYPDAADNSRFLANPTPARENDGAYLGEVEAPKFSHKRGFYDRPFLVTLATETEGATIHYTLDGAVLYRAFSNGSGLYRPSLHSQNYLSAGQSHKAGLERIGSEDCHLCIERQRRSQIAAADLPCRR